MVFTLDEIKSYLESQTSIEEAISNLSEQQIVKSIKDFTSLNFERTKKNIEKYEMAIGLSKIKDHQSTLYRNTKGAKGKYWLALSPKWIDDEKIKIEFNTEYEIAYWVNYGDNETYGWFSVEQIKKWLTTPGLKLSTIGGTNEKN